MKLCDPDPDITLTVEILFPCRSARPRRGIVILKDGDEIEFPLLKLYQGQDRIASCFMTID